MKANLTDVEIQATIDAIERFREQDPDLAKEYEIEFVIAQFHRDRILELQEFLKMNDIKYEKLRENGSDLLVSINMTLERDRVISIESYLTFFADQNGFKYDGWGAFE